MIRPIEENIMNTLNKFEKSFTVKTCNIPTVELRVAEVNKIAKRIDVSPITIELGEETAKRVVSKEEVSYVYFTDIKIKGEYPSIKGWSFIAQLDHVSKLVRSDKETNHRHLIGDTTCDHCGSNRQRNITYVIKNESSGDEMRVGGSCLKYYIPTKSINSLATFYEFISQFDGIDWIQGYNAPSVFSVNEIVSWSLMYSKLFGGYAAGGKTKDWIMSILNSSTKEDRKYKKEILNKVDFDKCVEEARIILEWISKKDASSDFMFNLKSSCGSKFIEYKQVGFAASSVSVYEKGLAREKEMQDKAALPQSEYVGTVKKRDVFSLKLISVKTIEGYYGDTYIHNFVDNDNNLLTWFGSSHLRDKEGVYIEKGTDVVVKATVKTHDEYNGVKQTVVQRVAFVA